MAKAYLHYKAEEHGMKKVVYIDIRKAYDSVNLDKLIAAVSKTKLG